MGELLAAVLAVAGGLTIVAGAYRALGIGRFLARTRAFLDDWQGEPDRPGFRGRPSFPERMAAVESNVETLQRNHGSSLRDKVDDVHTRVVDLQARAQSNRDGIDELQHRVTDHRRRNDEQATLLREAVDRRLGSVEGRLREIEARSRQQRHTDHPHAPDPTDPQGDLT